MNGIERAVEIFGAISTGPKTNLARAIGRSPAEIDKWLKRGWVPAKYCAAISAVIPVAIPLALIYGLDPDLAHPISLQELNPDLPDVMPVRTAEAEDA
jgi:hypothetical protein